MKALNVFKAVIVLAITVFLISCEKEDDNLKNQTAIKFEANSQALKSAQLKSASAAEVAIESFKINIEEIEIEFNDDDPMFLSDSVATDYELEGPFEVDLMMDGSALETTVVNNVELPSAAYDEIEFEFRESENAISMMYGKSILVEGTIDGTPFIFWSDEEMEVEIEFEELVDLDEASRAVLTVSFDIASLFNPAMGGIDISSAMDANENGIIEIYPESPDGNSDLAEMVWEKLEVIIEAFEDKYDD
ncbi:DUF4382 domain-containing protein [Geofilum rubicundum]|uniref:DUF4382 domain-containing protein n=1 Tax=Geofilum rubicundum JCM 15548 TaxID=1236989 RepID=A0A0E9LWB2_9BACT|nr:DUF4382 domain-containing protein [Geofilum rubicundum]GAO29401.1 hypothetical protein JCM15548_11582 [Geofilum rubicundum JCM 15548]